MKNTWRKIVEVLPGEIDLALQVLAESMGFDENVFSGVNTAVLEDADYITAVPIELALTSHEREIIMDKNPEIKYVVTKVAEDRVAAMIDNLDYDLISVDDYVDEYDEDEDVDEPVEIIDEDSYYQVGGLTVKGSDIYDVFDEDPKEDLYEDEEEVDEEVVPEEEEKKEEDENPKEEVHESYKINGKEVTREEFINQVPSFLASIAKFWK